MQILTDLKFNYYEFPLGSGNLSLLLDMYFDKGIPTWIRGYWGNTEPRWIKKRVYKKGTKWEHWVAWIWNVEPNHIGQWYPACNCLRFMLTRSGTLDGYIYAHPYIPIKTTEPHPFVLCPPIFINWPEHAQAYPLSWPHPCSW